MSEQNPSVDDILAPFFNRSSVRHFNSKKISQEIMDSLFRATLQTPTSSHEQAFSIINITNPQARETMAQLCDNQPWIVDSSHFLVMCADVHKILTWSNAPVEQLSVDALLASLMDASLAGMTLSLAAEQLGIGSVMIGAVRVHVPEVVSLLQLPFGVFPLFGLCLGYYDVRKPPKPRLPREVFVFENTYKLPDNDSQCLQEYHQTLAKYYAKAVMDHAIWSGRARLNVTWLEVSTQLMFGTFRENLNQDLVNQGFDLSKKVT